jgi:type II secretory pathway pseudopilin PulG
MRSCSDFFVRALPRRAKRGGTLVEVLFAVFLVGLSAMIIAATMPVANNSRAKASLTQKATGMAQKQLEALRGIGYANLTASQMFNYGLIDSQSAVSANTFSWTNADSAALDNPARILPNGVGRVSVEQVALDLKRVTVWVTYTDRGQNREVRLGTLIANL